MIDTKVPKCRVLVVDDSSTMRRLIRSGLESDPRIEVVGEAASAVQARDAVKSTKIDVMTLDVEMPGMNGLDFLHRLMKARPMPVVMVSSVTTKGSEAAVKAMSLGAVDCIEKPRFGSARDTFARLADLLVEVSLSAPARLGAHQSAEPRKPAPGAGRFSWNGRLVLIGASTGGVEALTRVFSEFPADSPPTLVTQHMPEQFLKSFAARLDRTTPPRVRLAKDGDVPKVGEVLIAPGGEHHMVFRDQEDPVIRLKPGPKVSGHKPSVDALFRSGVPFARRISAAILTGMGRDGAAGIAELKTAGATCFGQTKESCVVYGMPRVAAELDGLHHTVSLSDMAQALLASASKAADFSTGDAI